MKCPVCGNRDGGCLEKKRGAKFFCIHLRTNFKEYSNVPCHVRNLFKKSKFLPVKTPNEEVYMFDLDKGDHKTRIRGVDYEKFLEDYNMDRNDKIRFEIIQNAAYLSMSPLDSEGFPKDMAEEEEEYGLEANARAVVFSGGLKVNHSQVEYINARMAECGIGLGAIFVHRLTSTDIYNNGLSIPKHIVSVLGIRCSGIAYLVMDLDDKNDAEYFTSVDGRIRFKTGWTEFAADYKLDVGDTVLIMFHMIEDILHISFDFVD